MFQEPETERDLKADGSRQGPEATDTLLHPVDEVEQAGTTV